MECNARFWINLMRTYAVCKFRDEGFDNTLHTSNKTPFSDAVVLLKIIMTFTNKFKTCEKRQAS